MKAFIRVCLVILTFLPLTSFGCKPIAGREYEHPTAEQRLVHADLVFVGKVAGIHKAPLLEGVTDGHPYTFLIHMEVESWTKGGGNNKIDVFDTTGTDCDSLFGTNHIAMNPSPLSLRWMAYIRKHDGRNWLVTAEPLR
jgi:hypothetical protein